MLLLKLSSKTGSFFQRTVDNLYSWGDKLKKPLSNLHLENPSELLTMEDEGNKYNVIV